MISFSSWREGTQTQYKSVAKRWFEFCDKNSCDVISTPLPLAMSFLSDLFHSGLSYSYINTARSVLSSVLQLDGHIPFGQLPIVTKSLRNDENQLLISCIKPHKAVSVYLSVDQAVYESCGY